MPSEEHNTEQHPAASPPWGDLRFSRQSGPAGERVAARCAGTATAVATWFDASTQTDLTQALPELLMLGWIESSHQAGDDALEVEQIQVGTVNLTGSWEFYISDATGEVYQLPAETVVTWARTALTSLITSGVAFEALQDTPAADPGALTPDENTDENPGENTGPEPDRTDRSIDGDDA